MKATEELRSVYREIADSNCWIEDEYGRVYCCFCGAWKFREPGRHCDDCLFVKAQSRLKELSKLAGHKVVGRLCWDWRR